MIIRNCIFAAVISFFVVAPCLVAAEESSQQFLQGNKGVSEMFFSSKGKTAEPASVSALVGNNAESQPSLSDLFARVFKGLLYCVATILLCVSLYRRFFETQAPKSDELIKLLGKKTIAPKTALLVIETAGQKFLLSQTQDQVALLAELNATQQFDETLISLYDQDQMSQPQQVSANAK